MTVQLDRPEDLVLRGRGAAPDRGEQRPLTRRERRARERAVAEEYAARQLPPVEPDPLGAGHPLSPTPPLVTGHPTDIRHPADTRHPAAGRYVEPVARSVTVDPLTVPRHRPPAPERTSAPAHRAVAEPDTTLQLPLEPAVDPCSPLAVAALRVEAARPAPSHDDPGRTPAGADHEEHPFPTVPVPPALPAFPVATYHPRHHADPYAVGTCPDAGDDGHRPAGEWPGALPLPGLGDDDARLTDEAEQAAPAYDPLGMLPVERRSTRSRSHDAAPGPLGFAEPQFAPLPFNGPRSDAPTFDGPVFDRPVFDGQAFGDPRCDDPAFEEPAFEEPAFDDQAFDDQAFDDPTLDAEAFGDPRCDDQPFDDEALGDQPFNDPTFDDRAFDDQAFDDRGHGDDEPSSPRAGHDHPGPGRRAHPGRPDAPACEQGELPLTVELDARRVTGSPAGSAPGHTAPHGPLSPGAEAARGPVSGTGLPGEPATQALPSRRSLYRPLVPPPVTRPTAALVRPPVPVPPRPQASALARSTTQTLYRPTHQAPNRLLPPGRPGAPGLTPPDGPDPRTGATGRSPRPGGPRRGRRTLLAALGVVGIVAGVFGGLRAGDAITRVRSAERLSQGVGAGSTSGSGATSAAGSAGTGAVVFPPEIDRAATAPPAPAGDREAPAMPRVAGSVSGGVPMAAAGGQAAPTGRVNLYVYWVTSSTTRSLLAREYRSVPDYGDPLVSAVQAVLRLQPTDGDYGSPWRAASDVSVTATATGITVALSADAFSAPGIGSGQAAAGIQQLVWTVTAAAQREVPVTVQVLGSAGFQAWGAVTLGGAVTRDARFRASVWIDTPQQGSAQHGIVRIAGQGSAFEGTYRWQVTKAGKQVAAGVATGTAAGPGAGWTQFAVDVPLPAGAYRLTVTAEDPGDQEMPSGWTWPDTRDFTVA